MADAANGGALGFCQKSVFVPQKQLHKIRVGQLDRETAMARVQKEQAEQGEIPAESGELFKRSRRKSLGHFTRRAVARDLTG